MNPFVQLSPDAARVYEEFCLLQVNHPYQETALRQVRSKLGAADFQKVLVALIGATRIGKTNLLLRLQDEIAATYKGGPGLIPYLSVEARAPVGGFSLKEFVVDALIAAKEPLISQKVLLFEQRSSLAARQRALENILDERRPCLFAVDEAHHMVTHAGPQTLRAFLDYFKQLVNRSTTPFLFLASYEFLTVRGHSTQLNCRIEEVHIPPYWGRYRSDEDFASVLDFFGQRMPLARHALLLDLLDYLTAQSVGTVGVLKRWLDRALARAFEDGRTHVTEEDLRETRLPKWKVDQNKVDLENGELWFEEDLVPEAAREQTPKALQAAAARTHEKGRVGRRTPIRDKVGVGAG